MFTLNKLYEQINALCPIDRQTFDAFLPDAVLDLCCICGSKYLKKEEGAVATDFPIREEYYTALLSVMLYLIRGDVVDWERAIERAEGARDQIWRQKAEKNRNGGKK